MFILFKIQVQRLLTSDDQTPRHAGAAARVSSFFDDVSSFFDDSQSTNYSVSTRYFDSLRYGTGSEGSTRNVSFSNFLVSKNHRSLLLLS